MPSWRHRRAVPEMAKYSSDSLVVTGLIVLLVLVIFLNFKVALWVAIGIPTALAGAMGIMLLTGQSINMISLFGMILVLGIVVDDAIVVGAHAEMQRRRGLSGTDAAILGVQRMAAPVQRHVARGEYQSRRDGMARKKG